MKSVEPCHTGIVALSGFHKAGQSLHTILPSHLNTALHFTILHYTALHLTTLHYTALHLTTLHCLGHTALAGDLPPAFCLLEPLPLGLSMGSLHVTVHYTLP